MTKEYSEVMDDYYQLAEDTGRNCPDAWLDLNGVYWPNPHYKGEPVAHPEDDTVFHPDNTTPLRERYDLYNNR